MLAALTAAAGILGATGASASPMMIFTSTSQGVDQWSAENSARYYLQLQAGGYGYDLATQCTVSVSDTPPPPPGQAQLWTSNLTAYC